MPAYCASWNCQNRRGKKTKEKGITFHSFPKNEELRRKWALAVKRAESDGSLWKPKDGDHLCSIHFQEGDFDRTGQTTRLRPQAVPSIFDFPSHLQVNARPRSSKTSQRAMVEMTEEPLQHEQFTPSDILQDHQYGLPDAADLKVRLDRLNVQRESLEKELRNVKRREKRSRVNCQYLLDELQEKNLLSCELQAKLNSYADFPVELFQRPSQAYTEEQRDFALTLHFYSPKAYEYLRNDVNIPLPHPRTLCRWLETVDSTPGFNNSVFETLKALQNKEPETYTMCHLMLDAMAIRQQIEYDPNKKRMVGFVEPSIGDSTDEAKEVLVFMLVGIKGAWKMPVGYFFTRTLTASLQKELVLHALSLSHEAGLVITGITMDGHATNVAMSRMLGCKLDPGNMDTGFTDPSSENTLYVFFDACHMLKVVRNMLENYDVIHSKDGRVLWHFIKDLQSFQDDCGLRAANKLGKDHVLFQNQKMKVKLAAQVLSNSTSKALHLAHKLKLPKFNNNDCIATANFIEVFDTLFDIFNSRNLRSHGFKKPISKTNWSDVSSKLYEIQKYLLSLTLPDGKPLHSTRRFMSIIGFLTNIESLYKVVPKVLEVQSFLITYKLSQDHLELFFSAVRRAGGWNNNPSCKQFMAIFKKLIVHSGVKAGERGNVNDLDATSVITIAPMTLVKESPAPSPFVELDHNYAAWISPDQLSFVENIVAYIAGFVVKKIITEIECSTCRQCLVSKPTNVKRDEMFHLIQLKDNGGLVTPSQGVVDILLVCEKCIRRSMNVHSAKRICSQVKLSSNVKAEIGHLDPLHLSDHITSTQYGIDNHFFDLIDLLVQCYYKLRQNHVASLHTSKLSKMNVRQKFTKLITHMGQ